MKAVLMSIQPKWCELIAQGKKTVEVRKTKPDLNAPFKVYIYCTKNGGYMYRTRLDENRVGVAEVWNGKIIGEFICMGIMQPYDNLNLMSKQSCVPIDELIEYSNGNQLYGYRIHKLVMYDKPKELSDFVNTKALSYDEWFKSIYNREGLAERKYQIYLNEFRLKRPPQSWCYVKELRV